MKIIDMPLRTLPLTEREPLAERLLPLRQLCRDVAELVKLRLTLMVLFTVAIGYLCGSAGAINWWIFSSALLGTALVAAGASALNQYLETASDRLMIRTQHRPLPAGRLGHRTALRLGVLAACVGFVYLALAVNPLAALVAVVTLLSYVFAYTPLKRITSLNTLVGAIPGALPPLIGWAAAANTLNVEAMSLFFILFFWQFPHFWAIAWLYRDDYERAELKMLPGLDHEGGRMTGRLMLQSALALLIASLGPVLLGISGPRYAWCAVALGVVFVAFAVRFLVQPSQERARHVLWASLIYLPVVLLVLVLDGPLLGFLGT
jgi:protoheme IX farnesyltransferase